MTIISHNDGVNNIMTTTDNNDDIHTHTNFYDDFKQHLGTVMPLLHVKQHYTWILNAKVICQVVLAKHILMLVGQQQHHNTPIPTTNLSHNGELPGKLSRRESNYVVMLHETSSADGTSPRKTTNKRLKRKAIPTQTMNTIPTHSENCTAQYGQWPPKRLITLEVTWSQPHPSLSHFGVKKQTLRPHKTSTTHITISSSAWWLLQANNTVKCVMIVWQQSFSWEWFQCHVGKSNNKTSWNLVTILIVFMVQSVT